MLISTEIGSAAKRMGQERAVEAVAKAGFDAWDFTMAGEMEDGHFLMERDYLTKARHLKEIGINNGIFCNQAHGPSFPHKPGVKPYLFRAIECAAEAGAKVIVIHPGESKSLSANVALYQELLPFAKDCGVKIATENLYNWDSETNHPLFASCCTPESFLAHIEAVNDPFMVGCLDIGHAEMVIDGVKKSAVEFIDALGDKLQALHIHDNDLRWDSHRIPFSRNIDFEAIVKALKRNHYQGDFTLECIMHLRECPEGNELNALKELAAATRKLAEMFDAC